MENYNHQSHPVKCEHSLKHCSQCDVVFCRNCKEEWVRKYPMFTLTGPQTGTTTTGNPDAICSNTHN